MGSIRRQARHDKWILFLGASVLCLGLALQPFQAAWAGKIKSFSADQVFFDASGKQVHTSKLYITPDAYRMDGMPTGMGPNSPKDNLTVLGFKKENRQYIYNHDKKLYFPTDMDEEAMVKALQSYKNVDSEKVLGKEKVSGYMCVKKQVTSTMTIMGMKSTSTTIIWQSDKFEFPLRSQQENGGAMEFRNIKKGKPSAKLFRRPTGYKKVNNMMEVMGIDMQAMRAERKAEKQQARQAKGQKGKEVDQEKFMAALKQAMGKNADTEQNKQLQEFMAKAMDRAKNTKTDKGAADGLWQIIPKRSDDQVGSEMKTPGTYQVVLGTKADMKDVFAFYADELKSRGWKDGGTFIQDGQGFLNMTKDQMRLMVSSAEDPGMEGDFANFYSLQLHGPGL